MKRILAVPMRDITSLLIPYIIHCMLGLLSVLFLTPVAHSTVVPAKDFDLNHQRIVEEFKAKVLQHMGWSVPPRGYNTSQQNLHGKLIREFFRKKFGNGNPRDLTDDINNLDSHIVGLQTLVFPSTDPEVWVEVQPAKIPNGVQAVNTPPPSTPLTVVEFNTDFQQPEVPYHDLLIKSAILRMRISRQKRKLRNKDKSVVNVNFYLLRKASNISGDKVTATLLDSRTVNIHRKTFIEITIKPQLVSHILESVDKTVSIGISAALLSSAKHNAGRIQQLFQNSQEIIELLADHLTTEPILLSKATLRVTTVKKDLRKTRTKRQDNDSPRCTENCCKHSIYIDFADIGWGDWVAYPSGYTAYYCKGGCPDRFRVASSFTGIKRILHERDPDLVPAPVCAPTGYAPLDMIYWDEGTNPIDISYPNMVVTGCRCY